MSTRNRVWKFDRKLQKVVELTGFVEGSADPDAPTVISDDIPPTVSHATSEGLIFTSKSALRRHYRQHGFEETGGSHLTGRALTDCRHKANREEIKRDLLETRRKLMWGEIPVSEKEREVCRREERQYQEFKKRMGG